MDGYEATRRLITGGYRGPIIGLTANATPEDRNACLECGMINVNAHAMQFFYVCLSLSPCLTTACLG